MINFILSFIPIPTPTWNIEQVEIRESEMCATSYAEVGTDMAFAKTIATDQAKQKLHTALAGNIWPYVQLVEKELSISQNFMIASPEGIEMTLSFVSDTKEVEILEKWRRQYLWAMVCSNHNLEVWTGIVNDRIVRDFSTNVELQKRLVLDAQTTQASDQDTLSDTDDIETEDDIVPRLGTTSIVPNKAPEKTLLEIRLSALQQQYIQSGNKP